VLENPVKTKPVLVAIFGMAADHNYPEEEPVPPVAVRPTPMTNEPIAKLISSSGVGTPEIVRV
jgi:hypothetical protein